MTGSGAGEDEDPFAGLELDESFIAGAERTELSAAERIERHQRIDREHRRLDEERETERRREAKRGRTRGPRRRLLGKLLLVGIGLIVAVAAFNSWSSRLDPGAGTSAAPRRPPKSEESQAQPIGVPAPHAESPSFVFTQRQDGTTQPVAYDPCRPIHVVVNSRTQPLGGDLAVREGLAAVSRATGLQFVVDGPTTEVGAKDRAAYQPDLYPGRWAPVLISWTDPSTDPSLAGYITGLGGSNAWRSGDSSVYVTGLVQLDGPQFAEILAEPNGAAQARAIVEHELGHLVGLDHVNDTGQLMYSEATGQVLDYQAGDLTGLAMLGTGKCFPDL